NGPDRELVGFESLVDFTPLDRGGYTRVIAGARAVGAGQCLAQDVLQTVDVHALPSCPDGALGCRHLRVFVRHERGDDLAVERASLVRRPWRKGDVYMQTVSAGRLRPAESAQCAELVTDPARDVEHARERYAGRRIEVEGGPVGELRVRDA